MTNFNGNIQSIKQVQDVTIVAIEGKLELATAPGFLDNVKALISDGNKKIILDLSALNGIISSGVGAILAIDQFATENGGSCRLTGLKIPVLEVFMLLDLVGSLQVDPAMEDSFKAFGIEDS
ncbi:MAG: STAS domain-containing protein [bacterium]|nr:STAS domain-containing protein [bacterium]